MKVAIVTGASRGIGKAVALGLAKDGFSLSLVARSKDALNDVAKEIQQHAAKDCQVLTFPLDVASEGTAETVISKTKERFGRIDLLFNNAGIGTLGTLEVSAKEFENVLAVNLRGAFAFLQASVPIMKEQGSGYIMNVASRAGKIGFAGYGAYGASKFGLVGLSESLFHELAPLGIKVTTLCPSWVDTDMAAYSGIAGNEMIQPADIMETIRWLLKLSHYACVRELVIECSKDLD